MYATPFATSWVVLGVFEFLRFFYFFQFLRKTFNSCKNSWKSAGGGGGWDFPRNGKIMKKTQKIKNLENNPGGGLRACIHLDMAPRHPVD